LDEVFFAFIPDMRAQKDFRLAASLGVLGSGAGGLSLAPVVFLK
jgi:hypothetical protein